MKTCTKCKAEKEEECFYVRKGTYIVPICKDCVKQRVKQWVVNNRDKVKVNHKKWEEKNIEKEKQRHRDKAKKWYWNHIEEARKRQKTRRADDPEKTKIKDKVYRKKSYEKNRDKVLARTYKWAKEHPDCKRKERAEHPERVTAMNHKRRLQTSDLSAATVKAVYDANIKRHGCLTCYLCSNPIATKEDHLEHKIPLSRGGTNGYGNLDVACRRCNCKKHNKTAEEFLS